MDYWRVPLVVPVQEVNYLADATDRDSMDASHRSVDKERAHQDRTDEAPMDYWRIPISSLAGYDPAVSSTCPPRGGERNDILAADEKVIPEVCNQSVAATCSSQLVKPLPHVRATSSSDDGRSGRSAPSPSKSQKRETSAPESGDPFRCPECGEGFLAWGSCLEHLKTTRHRIVDGAVETFRRLMQECYVDSDDSDSGSEDTVNDGDVDEGAQEIDGKPRSHSKAPSHDSHVSAYADALSCLLGHDAADVECEAVDEGLVVLKSAAGLHIGDVILGTPTLLPGTIVHLAPFRRVPLRLEGGANLTTEPTFRGYVITQLDGEPNGDRLFVGDVICGINGVSLEGLDESTLEDVFGENICDGAMLTVDPKDGMRAEVAVDTVAMSDFRILEHRYGLSALNGGQFFEIYGQRSALIAAIQETCDLVQFYTAQDITLARTPPRICIEELEWEWALLRQVHDEDEGVKLEAPDDGPGMFEGQFMSSSGLNPYAAPFTPRTPIDIEALDAAPPVDVIILAGLPGSGKSTFSRGLRGWVVVNQDTLGSRNACLRKFYSAMRDGHRVVVDRCNFSKTQRSLWMYRGKSVGCIWLDVPEEECIYRVLTRFGHKKLSNDPQSAEVVRNFANLFEKPSVQEGFTFLWRITTHAQIDKAKDLLFPFARSGDLVTADMLFENSISSTELHALRRQIEYYFSDANLPTDVFFQSKLVEDSLIHTDHILGCPRVQKLWATREDIVTCLQKSHLRIVERGNDIYVGNVPRHPPHAGTGAAYSEWRHQGPEKHKKKSRREARAEQVRLRERRRDQRREARNERRRAAKGLSGHVRKPTEGKEPKIRKLKQMAPPKSEPVKVPFRCPECKEGFASWTLALDHLQDTEHRRRSGGAAAKRELMQEFMREAETYVEPPASSHQTGEEPSPLGSESAEESASDVPEISPSSPTSPEISSNSLTASDSSFNRCWDFAKKGKCRRGDTCRWPHTCHQPQQRQDKPKASSSRSSSAHSNTHANKQPALLQPVDAEQRAQEQATEQMLPPNDAPSSELPVTTTTQAVATPQDAES
eukprot:GEMP01004895.1.p1 GENE.GEMP01004895.1~~GEMP01004895.1.p1  ORF type:complete len:1050 (+),score=252.46 GEMP01004895.1:58-3207(+)